MRRSRLLGLVLVALTAALPSPRAEGGESTRLRLERVDLTDFSSEGTVKVYASVVELEGNVVDDKGPGSFTLLVNGKSMGKPAKLARFAASAEPLDLALVVESSALYGPRTVTPKSAVPPPVAGKSPKGAAPAKREEPPPQAGGKKKRLPPPPPPSGAERRTGESIEPLEKVKDALRELVEQLHPKWRVLVIEYGGEVLPHPPFRAARSVTAAIDELATDEESGDLRLIDAVRAAIAELGRQKVPEGQPAPRRLIVVVSDGINMQMDRKAFRSLGDAAQAAHVPIHSIAYSPTDDRGPLLNLGEISKRSFGTFRWAKSGNDLHAQLETLAEELSGQYVLTYKVDASSLERARFQLQSDDLVSNEFSLTPSAAKQGGPSAERSRLWVWLLVGLGLAGLVAGALVLVRRLRARPKRPSAGVAMARSPASGGAAAAGGVAPPAASVPSAPAATGGGPTGLLIFISGTFGGQRFQVTAAQPIVVGKGAGNLIIQDDPTVSTSHAQFTVQGGRVLLTDLGSTNGSFVNGQRVTQPVALSDGDLVRLGNTQIKFRME